MFAQRGEGDYLSEIRTSPAERCFGDAQRQATAVIEGPATFSNPQRQAYLLSLAYLHRSEARRGLGTDEKRAFSDVYEAAMLGNLAAIRQLVEAWTGSAVNGEPSTAREPGESIWLRS